MLWRWFYGFNLWCVALIYGLSTVCLAGANLIEPITLTSKNGVLDILMIAKAAPIATLPASPIGWVFQICPRPSDKSNTCPSEVGATPNYYGGTRLQVERGDLLKVRLVNQLPLALDSEHATEPDQQYLMLNPVNLHTDGLIVSPQGTVDADATYGDNLFVLTFNSANGKPAASPHLRSTVRYDYTDYSIRIPIDHPSGLFWFHPQTHGLASNQMSAGLAGIITVGHVNDYVCKRSFCSLLLPQIGVRHIILKDTQILPDGSQQTQEDAAFSDVKPDAGEGSRLGIAAGADATNVGGRNYKTGNWYFTLNGLIYPTFSMNEPAGEIWRITNASGGATYDLKLFNPAQNRNMIMQVISADGVSISPDAGITTEQLAEVGGAKFKPEPCPAAPSLLPSTSQAALCTRELLMMPSSRVEVWVSYRNSNDMVAPTPRNSYAVLRTEGYQTGPAGDSWPAVDLARVNFASPVQINTPAVLGIGGEANTVANGTALAKDLLAANKTAVTRACQALPPGHMRRIFYAKPTADQNAYGLAYEEVDENGNIVGPAATDVTPYDRTKDSICLPLGSGNTPVYERWQLVNVAEEDHNFHMQETKFRVLTRDEQMGAATPGASYGTGIEFDNVPLPHAEGTCGSNPPADLSNPIADWRAGLCKAHPVTVEIAFVAAGTFVYNCHVLEHEDGGMMAVIQVTPAQ